MQGTPLHDYSLEELSANRFMRPWSFNLMATAIASFPAMILINWYGPKGLDPAILGTLDERTNFVLQKTIEIAETLSAAIPPVLLTLSAYSASWASLGAKKHESAAFHRGVRAYLYYDGAYGLVAEMFLSIYYVFGALGISPLINLGDEPRTVYLFVNTILFFTLHASALLSCFYLIWVKYDLIGPSLFKMNGWEEPHYPWMRYIALVLFGLVLMHYLLLLILMVLAALAGKAWGYFHFAFLDWFPN